MQTTRMTISTLLPLIERKTALAACQKASHWYRCEWRESCWDASGSMKSLSVMFSSNRLESHHAFLRRFFKNYWKNLKELLGESLILDNLSNSIGLNILIQRSIAVRPRSWLSFELKAEDLRMCIRTSNWFRLYHIAHYVYICYVYAYVCMYAMYCTVL